jgi:SAM-dependent methyltransferase
MRNSIELGCGLGRLTFAFLDAGFTDFIGVDVSSEMIRGAAVQSERLGISPQSAKFMKSDGVNIPVDSETVDFAFSYLVLQHMPTKAIVQRNLAELCRVLRDGGTLLFQIPTINSGLNGILKYGIKLANDWRWQIAIRIFGLERLVEHSQAMHGTRFWQSELKTTLSRLPLQILKIQVGPLSPTYTGKSEWERAYHTWVLAVKRG